MKRQLVQTVVQFDATPWSILVSVVLSVGASLLAIGSNTDTSAFTIGLYFVAVACLVTIAIFVMMYLRSAYYRRAHLMVQIPENKNVAKCNIEDSQNTCSCCCGTFRKVSTLFRLEVRNTSMFALTNVRLYCYYNDEKSYFLRLRHDNFFRRSDTGELLIEDGFAVFDLAIVKWQTTCRCGCNANVSADIEFQFADAGLPSTLAVRWEPTSQLSIKLTASGLISAGGAATFASREMSLKRDEEQVQFVVSGTMD